MPTPELEILYDNGPCLVVNKPPGVLTQAPAGIDSMEVRVKAFYREREQKEGNIYLGLPHRLDRPVSGAIVFARHVRAAQRLSSQFENRTVTKVYWAVVEGDVQPDEGTWTDHLHKRHGMPQSIVVPEGDPRGKIAVMRYRVLGRIEGVGTWLEVELETGRTHQIRVQCASRGHAVIGDAQYGSTRAVRRAVRGRAAASDRASRAAARFQSPDDERTGGCDCAVVADVGSDPAVPPVMTSGRN